MPCPSHDRSVLLSPGPAAEYTYAATARADCDADSEARSADLPTVMLDADRFARTVAPASAAYDDGGMADQ